MKPALHENAAAAVGIKDIARQTVYLVNHFCPGSYWGWTAYSWRPGTGRNAIGAEVGGGGGGSVDQNRVSVSVMLQCHPVVCWGRWRWDGCGLTSLPYTMRWCVVIKDLNTTTQLVLVVLSNSESASWGMLTFISLVQWIKSETKQEEAQIQI